MNKADLEKKVKELRVVIERMDVESLDNMIDYEGLEDDFMVVSDAVIKAEDFIKSFLYVDGFEGGETNKPYQRALIRILTILEGEE